MERTLAIIKPDAVRKKVAGEILARYEKAGFRIAAMKMVRMTPAVAAGFYAVHKKRPFFKPLCKFMSSGPCIVLALEGKNVIEKNRKLMGATDSKQAARGTIRARFGADIQNNAVHGSDGPDTAAFEIGYFFNAFEFVD
ncbi:MAG TPA: nucleoside-diphosphate kinase [bacterium]|nr:nucleoside-diphosphate kinase [bacterium]